MIANLSLCLLTLAPGSDRIPVELFQILTQYAICRLPAGVRIEKGEVGRRKREEWEDQESEVGKGIVILKVLCWKCNGIDEKRVKST